MLWIVGAGVVSGLAWLWWFWRASTREVGKLVDEMIRMQDRLR